jgi:hypothetical protein
MYSTETILKNLKKSKKKNCSRNEIFNVKNHENSDKLDTINSEIINSLSFKQESSQFSDVKYFVKNITYLLCNNEFFESAIKEFVSVADFPSENKDKTTFLKKLIPIYKRIRDTDKIDSFLLKIAYKLNERKEDLQIVLEILYNKNKRERLLLIIYKLISKLTSALAEKGCNYIIDLNNIRKYFYDKYKPLEEKIDKYCEYNHQIR